MARSFCAGLLAVALSAGAVEAQTPRYVVSGHTLRLGFFASINPDCSARGMTTVRITRPPQNGRVRTVRESGFAVFPAGSVYAQCSTRRVQGVALYYTSRRGFIGTESIGGEAFFPSGRYTSGSFLVHVR